MSTQVLYCSKKEKKKQGSEQKRADSDGEWGASQSEQGLDSSGSSSTVAGEGGGERC